MMPRVNGWDVLRAIENGGAPRSPVIITTAQEGDWVAEARKHPFVVATLRKPYNIDELISLVETYCPRSES
jgi:CheY-like chemotaxis protein